MFIRLIQSGKPIGSRGLVAALNDCGTGSDWREGGCLKNYVYKKNRWQFWWFKPIGWDSKASLKTNKCFEKRIVNEIVKKMGNVLSSIYDALGREY
jgi:hypothetical protein